MKFVYCAKIEECPYTGVVSLRFPDHVYHGYNVDSIEKAKELASNILIDIMKDYKERKCYPPKPIYKSKYRFEYEWED